jgi:germination protein M
MKKILIPPALLCIAALAGCAPHHASTPVNVPPSSPTPVVSGNTPAPPPATPHQAVIYTVNTTQGTNASNYLVPQTIALKDPHDPAAEAVRALIAAPESPIPHSTKLNSIKIADGLATVDFSRSPVDETGGEEKQSQALEALQMTLGQFPNVSRIQITVNGQPLPAIGEAAGGPMDAIRPGQTPPETGGA